ncbi:aldo/keto reductase [Jiella pacifica]|uniref:Aldo/keto reductase n=1 Tax=Jiella pacifica TaxID=2696469 RepID=A0A6N9SYW4_9HYPH|nr:aldo/keto reductase [Jiella pacifica]NDW04283.1 aldo/keto reductase [Jiella pacifica]
MPNAIARRTLLKGAAATGVLALAGRSRAQEAPSGETAGALLTRQVPSSGIELPVVGMGTWITFNVGNDSDALAERTAVMKAFFGAGGAVIDSSPMYGSSQATVGHGLEQLGIPDRLFAADKVWTSDVSDGQAQIEATRQHWGVDRFGLMQVHNLLGWPGHLETLQALKEEGLVGHIGITTSHGRRHDDIEEIMARQPIDFVQLTYNIADREPERRLLPLASERGIAVVANRPFQRGALIEATRGAPLPGFAAEIGAETWPKFLLKFIVSHPALTVAIPATRSVDHVRENMAAARGPLPDAEMRRQMADHFDSL